jgi:putative transcriptional regulator
VNTAHKLQDEWLLSYAAGALSPVRSLMVSSHIAYHDDLQVAVADAESIGGAFLDNIQEAGIGDAALDKLMSRIDANPTAQILPVAASDSVLPQPLREFVDSDLDALKWRFMGPGMSNARLWDGPNGERLWLLKARGGVTVPEHGHNGEEWTLVLKGSYQTEFGKFGVGDIEVAGEELEHQPVIDAGEECICLVMTEGPIRLKSMLGRMVQPFIGL